MSDARAATLARVRQEVIDALDRASGLYIPSNAHIELVDRLIVAALGEGAGVDKRPPLIETQRTRELLQLIIDDEPYAGEKPADRLARIKGAARMALDALRAASPAPASGRETP